MKLILQHDERDCGVACLSMIAAYYGLNLPISQYRELTKTDKSGTNLYGLVNGAEKIGLKAEALSGTPDELEEGIANGEIGFPFIAHTVSEDAMLHYVVVYGLKHGRFQIADPGKGKRRMALEQFFSCWTGYIVTFEKTGTFRQGNETKGSFVKFFAMLKGQYRRLALILALSLLISAIGILGSFVFQLVLDDLTPAYEEGVESHTEEAGHTHRDESPAEQLLESIATHTSDMNLVFCALIGLYLLQAGIQLARSYLIILMSRKIDIRLTLSYYNHIMELPVSSVMVRQTGEYLSRFSDTATIRQAISTATLTLLMDSLMVVACGFILYTQNARLFYVSLLMIFFYAVVVLSFRKPIERSNRNVMERDARLQSYFKESIDGVETVKAARAEEQVKEKTTEEFYGFIDAILKNSIISASQDTLVGTIELAGTVVILWMGVSMALAGQVTIGSVITFYALLAYFTEPIKNLIELQPTLQTAFVAADRLNDILELKSEDMKTGAVLPNEVSRWDFQNVDFRYGNRELTLHKVSLTLRQGEKIAIVGESGSGKTTLAKLIMRFYEPERGKILAEGQNINQHVIPIKNSYGNISGKLDQIGSLYSFLETTFIKKGTYDEFIHECIESVISNIRKNLLSTVKKERVQIVCSTKDLTWFVPKGVLLHVFYNLINNSLYWIDVRRKRAQSDSTYVYPGTDTIAIEEYGVDGIVVYDTGTGVSKSMEDILFEPLQSGKPLSEGRGMGLYIVRKLLNSFGGEIELLDERNEYGNRYKFLLVSNTSEEL